MSEVSAATRRCGHSPVWLLQRCRGSGRALRRRLGRAARRHSGCSSAAPVSPSVEALHAASESRGGTWQPLAPRHTHLFCSGFARKPRGFPNRSPQSPAVPTPSQPQARSHGPPLPADRPGGRRRRTRGGDYSSQQRRGPARAGAAAGRDGVAAAAARAPSGVPGARGASAGSLAADEALGEAPEQPMLYPAGWKRTRQACGVSGAAHPAVPREELGALGREGSFSGLPARRAAPGGQGAGQGVTEQRERRVLGSRLRCRRRPGCPR